MTEPQAVIAMPMVAMASVAAFIPLEPSGIAASAMVMISADGMTPVWSAPSPSNLSAWWGLETNLHVRRHHDGTAADDVQNGPVIYFHSALDLHQISALGRLRRPGVRQWLKTSDRESGRLG